MCRLANEKRAQLPVFLNYIYISLKEVSIEFLKRLLERVSHDF